MNKFFKAIILTCVIYLTISLVVNPEICIDSGRKAVEVCLDVIIPSLFPFFICSGIFFGLGLARICSKNLSPMMRPLFNVSGSGALAFVLGIVSGYPMGAVAATDLYRTGECTKTEAERMLAFCNNSGPLFVIGVVGCGFLKSKEIGYYLYISHIISAILTGIIFRGYKGKKEEQLLQLAEGEGQKKKNIAIIIGNVFENSISSILKICAFVIFFSVFAATLPDTKLKPIIHSFFEISGGIAGLSEMKMELIFKLCIISFALAFSGVSIMFQVMAVSMPHGLSIMPYVKGKLVQACLSSVITYFMVTRLPITRNVFAWSSHFFVQGASPLTLILISFICCLLGIVITFCISQISGRIGKSCS